jgi:hypothetical protein
VGQNIRQMLGREPAVGARRALSAARTRGAPASSAGGSPVGELSTARSRRLSASQTSPTCHPQPLPARRRDGVGRRRVLSRVSLSLQIESRQLRGERPARSDQS